MFPYYYRFDNTYLLVLLGFLISMLAQANIQKSFARYSKIKTQKNVKGIDAVNYILNSHNYTDIKVKRVAGSLSDYFNPISKEIALSDTSLKDTSIAAVSVAAHECGHVIQFKEGYMPLKIKSRVVPIVNFGSRLSMPALFLGLIFAQPFLIKIGIFLFSFMVIFQLITLPVEFDASRRALNILEESGMLVGQENEFAKDMLKSAAYTYISASLAISLQFLRLFLLFGRGNNRRD